MNRITKPRRPWEQKPPHSKDFSPGRRRSGLEEVWGGAAYRVAKTTNRGGRAGLFVCGVKRDWDAVVELSYEGIVEIKDTDGNPVRGHGVKVAARAGAIPSPCTFVKLLPPVPDDGSVDWFLVAADFSGDPDVGAGLVAPIPIPTPRRELPILELRLVGGDYFKQRRIIKPPSTPIVSIKSEEEAAGTVIGECCREYPRGRLGDSRPKRPQAGMVAPSPTPTPRYKPVSRSAGRFPSKPVGRGFGETRERGTVAPAPTPTPRKPGKPRKPGRPHPSKPPRFGRPGR